MPELRPKQREAVEFMARHRKVILADPPGEGKTPTTVEWLKEIGACSVLIVANNDDVAEHWCNIILAWHPDLYPLWYKGGPAKRAEWRNRFQMWGAPVALVMQYGTLRTDGEQLAKMKFDAVVFDEGHRLKGRGTQQTKAAQKVAKGVSNIAFTTGTPVVNRSDELWSYLHIIDPKTYRSYWKWVHEHYNVTVENYRGRQVFKVGKVRPDQEEAVREQITHVLLQRDAEPWGPDPIEIPLKVHLSPAERATYDKLKKHSWAEFPDGTVVRTNNALARMTRLRQLVADWSQLGGTDGGSKVQVAVDKIEELVEAGEQVLVFAHHKTSGATIARMLHDRKIKAKLYNGGLDAKERALSKAKFIEGDAKVLIGTFGALAEGVDGLQHVARYIVMLDRDWTPKGNAQAIGRLHRRGQERQVVVYHVFAEDTIDETVYEANLHKQAVIDWVVGKEVEVIA